MTNGDLHEQMTAYLLGELSDTEQAALEDLYFADEAVYQELLAAEDELIDSYARGELADKSREQFESLFLGSAHRREKLEIARVLIRSVDHAATAERLRETFPRSRRRFDWRFSSLSAAMALAIGIGVVLFHRHLGGPQLPEANSEPEPARNRAATGQRQSEELESPPRRHTGDIARSPDSAPPDVPLERLTLRLRPMLRGEGESRQPVIRSSLPIVRLEVDLEGRLYETYEANLQDAKGNSIRRQSGLSRRGRTVLWELDPRGLPSGSYVVVLSGRDAREVLHLAAQYSLQIR
jgi:hypothetical protein